MTQDTDMAPNLIEINNFVSPNAANDAPDDTGMDLEMDFPVAAVEVMDALAAHAPVATIPNGWTVAETGTETPVVVDALPVEIDSGTTLEADLTTIAAQGTANALGQASGSLAAGTMRGVGFSNAQGYVTALANGVKQGTADLYKRTLASTYAYTAEQIAALTITIIPEGDLPVSMNPVVIDARVNGVIPVFNRATRQAQQAALPTQTTTPETTAIQAAITPGTLIANLLQDRSGKIYLVGRSDRRATHRTRTELVAALSTVARADLAPRLKTSKAQFGEVMRGLNAPGLRMRAWNVTRRDVQKAGQEWPADLASRWCVGVLDGTDALGSLGEKVLIADLLVNNEIRFTGGNDAMHQKVNEAFSARIGEEVYNATDVLNWFRRMMQDEYHTVSVASGIFVPGNAEQTATVSAMVAALRPVMSRSIVEIDAVTGQGLLMGLAEGLADEVSEIAEAFDTAQEKARDRDRAKLLKATPNASQDEIDLAMARAVVLPEAAATFVRRLNDKTDRVTGYEFMIGTDLVKPVRAAIAALRAKVEPLCDATSLMGANIELD
jgi:hypothetical protein